MINKLPRWVEFGGGCLALNAGFINAIGLLGVKHQAMSHLTGTSTFLSLALANQHYADVLHLLLVMLSFVLGAAYSGVVIGNTALKLGRRYSATLLTESGLLLLSMLFLSRGSDWGHLFASAACGMQNAMTSSYSGAIVRTTHVSGLFTDLGVSLGMALRGQRQDRRRVVLYLILAGGFMAGGVLGSLCFLSFQFAALWIPCALTAALALAYRMFLHRPSAVARQQ